MPQIGVPLEEISTYAGKKRWAASLGAAHPSRRLLFVRNGFNLNRPYCTVSWRLSVIVVAPLVTFTGTV